MVRMMIIMVMILILIFSGGCDFFITSAFPDYLTTARKVENIGKYFNNSNSSHYDMFVIQDNMAEDYVFVLYKPDDTNRKVVVFDSDLNFVTQYSDQGLGSLHTGFSGGQQALVGLWNVDISAGGTFVWNTTPNIPKDYFMLFNSVGAPATPYYYLMFATATGNDIQVYGHNSDANFSIPAGEDGFFSIGPTGEEYILENACYIETGNPGDLTDDVDILFLRRRADNEGMAIGIPAATSMPAAEFPNTAISPILDNHQTYHFGKIKPGSVHVVFGGRGVVLEHDDGEVNLYDIYIDTTLNVHYNKMNDTGGRQFDDKVVAYSMYKPDYYVFDPSTKDLFRCKAWWE
jgi:hypothetical protein